MENDPNAKLLRIFIGESDKMGNQPLYEAIVLEARRQLLSGATVIRGIMGYGANSRIHTAKIFELSTDLPLIIEIVDTKEKIEKFIPVVEHMFENSRSGGLITIEKAVVIRYKSSVIPRNPA